MEHLKLQTRFWAFLNATLRIIICPFGLAAGELGSGLLGALLGGKPGGVNVPTGTLHTLLVGEHGGELPTLELTGGVAGGLAGGVAGLSGAIGKAEALDLRLY